MSRLNVVLVVFDTARRDRFGCYGYPRPTTPVVDGLAREGLLFEHMITPAPWTVPSHASLFSGLYPREHSAEFPVPLLRNDVRTMARHLRAAGYRTVAVTANALLTRTGLEEGFDEMRVRKDVDFTWLRRRARFVLGWGDTGAEGIARYAVRLLRGSLRPPFFLLLNFMECHWPYLPPRRFERRFLRRPLSWMASARRRQRERRVQAWEGVARAGEAGLAQLHDMYDASLATADERFGRVLEALRRARLDGETVVIVTADHGENIGDHGLATHQGSLHRTLIHVPFIVRIPGRSPARIEGLAQFTDVFAGLCRLLRLDPPEALVDRPMAVDPFTLPPTAPGREYAFAEWSHWGDREMNNVQQRSPTYDLSTIPVGLDAVQDRRFKLVIRRDTAAQTLYDLETDPGELHDAAAQLPDVLERLRGALWQWREAFPQSTLPVYTPEEAAAVELRLRENGYV